jgi:hypothetical protein
MWGQEAANARELQAAIRLPRPHWPGFLARKAGNTEVTQGQLCHLSFGGAGSMFPRKLQNWTSHTNFEQLHSLNLGLRFDNQSFQTLTRMAENEIFRSLQDFSFLGIDDLADNDANEAFRDLIQALPPLTSLTDDSSSSEEDEPNAGSKATFMPILERHAHSLKILKTTNWFSYKNVQSLR